MDREERKLKHFAIVNQVVLSCNFRHLLPLAPQLFDSGVELVVVEDGLLKCAAVVDVRMEISLAARLDLPS